MVAVSPNSSYINTDLYNKYTDEVIYGILGSLSLSSTFAVNIKDDRNAASATPVSFLAYEASLPGTSFQTTDVFGDRQGVTETFANRRTFSPVDISFYVQSSYQTIGYFDDWVRSISPLNGGELQQTSYFKFAYPNTYKKNINIIKYERDIRPSSERLKEGGGLNDPNSITYTLINAYPTNVSAIPVSFDQSSVLRMSITFNYDRYTIQQHAGQRYKASVVTP
jgi:hypothetical protein